MDLARNLIRRINVGDTLTRTAAARPGQLAVVDGDRRLPTPEFNGWVNRLAHGLAALGYAARRRARLASGNSAEFLAVYYACAKLGVVCVPVNLGWRPDEVAYVLEPLRRPRHRGGTQLVGALQRRHRQGAGDRRRDRRARHGRRVRGRARRPGLADRRGPDPARDASEPECFVEDRDALSYLYTSGTTSFPKGVVGTHVGDLPGVDVRRARLRLERPTDRFAAMMPMFHTAQLNAFCTPAVMVGATIYVLRGFDPAALLDLIEREQITQVFGLPMMFRAALDHPSLRRAGTCPACAARCTRWRRCRTS